MNQTSIKARVIYRGKKPNYFNDLDSFTEELNSIRHMYKMMKEGKAVIVDVVSNELEHDPNLILIVEEK